jgi:hypothetical protein
MRSPGLIEPIASTLHAGRRDADHRHADPRMGERRAPGGARQSSGAPQRERRRRAANPGSRDDLVQPRQDQEHAEPDAERRRDRAAGGHRQEHEPSPLSPRPAPREPLRRAEEIAALPRHGLPERQQEQQRDDDRQEGRR